MKKTLSLILILTMNTALLIGCTAAAQSVEDTAANAAYAEPALQQETVALVNVPVEQAVSAASAGSGDLCAVCADEDCDGGEYCNNADQREENRKSNTPCKNCGDDDCDGGIHCGNREERHNQHPVGHHSNDHHNNN